MPQAQKKSWPKYTRTERNHIQIRIVVTRAEPQAKSWCQSLEREGFTTVNFPVMEIVPVSDNAHKQAVKTHILELDDFSVLIFVSQNAVAHGFNWIDDYWPQFPETLSCLAVGAKTEQAVRKRLEQFGVHTESHINADSKMDSEALLAMPVLEDVKDKKILIFRGLGGRTKLYETLQARGAHVSHCELYERKLPLAAAAQLKQLRPHIENDIVTVFSGESLENLHSLLQKETKNWQDLSIVVPSARVSEQAATLGFKKVTQALNATEEAMYQALLTLKTF